MKPRNLLPASISLTRSEQQRLVHLARDADCSANKVLRDVSRDGFDYTEYKIKAINEGLADLSSGRMKSLDELKAHIVLRRAERDRARERTA